MMIGMPPADELLRRVEAQNEAALAEAQAAAAEAGKEPFDLARRRAIRVEGRQLRRE